MYTFIGALVAVRNSPPCINSNHELLVKCKFKSREMIISWHKCGHCVIISSQLCIMHQKSFIKIKLWQTTTHDIVIYCCCCYSRSTRSMQKWNTKPVHRVQRVQQMLGFTIQKPSGKHATWNFVAKHGVSSGHSAIETHWTNA